MTAELALSAVNAATDLLVVVAIASVFRHRRDALTFYLLLAFATWLVNDVADVLIQRGILEAHVVFYNLSTLNSASFLLAVAHLRRQEGGRFWGPGGLWKNELLNPVTSAALLVILLTLALERVAPEAGWFAVPDLLLALFMWVVMGWSVYQFIAPTSRAVALLSLFTFGMLTGLVVAYLLQELRILGGGAYLPMKLLSVLAHLLIVYIVANVVARSLWRKLVAEQEDLARVIESSPSAILVADEHGAVERVNATARRILPGAPTAPAQADIAQLLPGVAWSPERVARLQPGAVVADHVVVPSGADDGAPRHLRAYVAPLSAEADGGGKGHRRRYVVMAADVGDELERARLAVESERAKTLSVLSGGTIHHFHNKLLAIRTGLRFLETRMAAEQALALRIPTLVRATDQAFTLSQQLAGNLKMAREGDFEAIDLRGLIETALEDVADRRPPDFTVEFEDASGRPPERPVVVRGVRGFLKMVLENLAANAFDAARPGAPGSLRVRLLLSPGGRTTQVVFEDRGTGVAEAARHQLFVPFFTTKEAAGGTGFGLYWSRRLVEAMGGSLELEWTETGTGSRFCLELPVPEPESGAPPARPQERSADA
jgi:signal transduction histidine kinase